MTGRSVSAVSAYTAHREWASRPPDERYASVHALFEAARARRQQLEERTIETGDFRTEAVDDDLAFRESSGRTATLTHWSFGQLATIAANKAAENNIACRIYDEKGIKELGMGALLGVGQGSVNPPRFVVLEYQPEFPAKTQRKAAARSCSSAKASPLIPAAFPLNPPTIWI